MTKNRINRFPGDSYKSSIKTLFESVGVSSSYSSWRKRFTYIHGVFDTQRKIDVRKLEEAFNVKLGSDKENLFKLIYCLETHYSIILRIIAHKALFGKSQFIRDIFDDKTYIAKGISNYTCCDCYNWFLPSSNAESVISNIYQAVNLEDLETEGDAISILFESIFPKELRHSLGEYYTPYWLANTVIEQITKDDNNAFLKRYIDPTCGSGTFIIALIKKYQKISNNLIFSNVCGIDINPLTVLAAKTNFILLYVKHCVINPDHPIEIPIYCADTIAINDESASDIENSQYDTIPQTKYDYIIGNPPWVNWEYLPDDYRMQHANLWRYYELFTTKGLNACFIKEDISVLMTYVVIDKYLKDGGKIGFVIKETLFKSIKQGEGFRKFKIIPSETDLKVLRVDDLTKIKPFNGAVTRTAIIYIEKGSKTHYPVDYIVWNPLSKRKSLDNGKHLEPADYFAFETLKGHPSVKTAINSGWITEAENEMNYSKFILGTNKLTARTGVFTGGANGIFWLNIDDEVNNNVIVSNITERAKNKMKKVQLEVEKEFVFPLMTGNDLDFWSYRYSKYILCPHTSETKMYPIDLSELTQYPLTKRYFSEFQKELEDRKGFTSMDDAIHEQFFYTLQRIGAYTFAKYKVCWRYICKTFIPAVVEYGEDIYLGKKNIISNEKIISIAFDNRDEAYYVCAVISSTPYRKTIENYMVGTQITPSIIGRLNVPQFDNKNAQHLELSRLCQEGHLTKTTKSKYLKQIDGIIQLWLK